MSLINKLPDYLSQNILEVFLDFKTKINYILTEKNTKDMIITENEFINLIKINKDMKYTCDLFINYYGLNKNFIKSKNKIVKIQI